MWYKRMELEIWFDRYQYEIDYDIGESAVKTQALGDLDIDLSGIPLRYGHHRGRPDLREEIAGQYPNLTADNILVTTGASEANFIVVSALVKPGQEVIVEIPNYPSLYEVPRSLGCGVKALPLLWKNRFKPDLEHLESLITPETKLISLTHPNNPTGSMITNTELDRIVRIAERHGIHLLFDETYRHLAFSAPLRGAASLSHRVISISSMSKCYGLPGIRTGWLAARDTSLLDSVLAIREQVSIANNALSEEIALAVLQRKDVFLEKAKKRLDNNRSLVADWMGRQDRLEWIPPEEGVVCFPRLTDDVKTDPEVLYRRLAETYRTFVVPGRCFEMDNRHFRLGFGAEAGEIEAGLANLSQALSED